MATFKCPDCKNKVSEKAEACPKCGRVFTPEEINNLSKTQKKAGSIGCAVFIIIAALFFFFSDTEEKATPVVETAPYKIIEVDDTSTATLKRFGARVVVGQGLAKDDIEKILNKVADETYREKKADMVTVWMHHDKDEQMGGYSVAMLTNDYRKNEIGKVIFNDYYFMDPTSYIVSRIPEQTRKAIYKESIAIERRAGKIFDDELSIQLAKGVERTNAIKIAAGKQEMIKTSGDKELLKKYKITEEECDNIGMEAFMKSWAME